MRKITSICITVISVFRSPVRLKIWEDWKEEIQNTKSEPRCKWVKEIEGFGISTNWLFSKLIERRENRPPKAPLFTCFNRLWLRLIFSSVGIFPNVEDCNWELKFIFSKKATKIDEIFTVDLTLCSKCQIDCEYFVSLCGLLRKHEL